MPLLQVVHPELPHNVLIVDPIFIKPLLIQLVYKLANCIDITNLPAKFHGNSINGPKVIVNQSHIKQIPTHPYTYKSQPS